MLLAAGTGVTFMRDATRGAGRRVADLAGQSGLHVVLDESAIPIRPEARHAADMLGLDALDIANEGKVVMAVMPRAVNRVMAASRRIRWEKRRR